MVAINRAQPVKIFVRSKKVAVRSMVVQNYSGSFIGVVASSTRFVDYEDRLDDTQQRMIDYASDLAMSADLPIKVIDVAKLSPLERFTRRIFRQARVTPTIELPEAMFLHMEHEPPKIWEGIGVIPR